MSARRARSVPKPQGALSALWDYEAGRLGQQQEGATPFELQLLYYIAESADLLTVPTSYAERTMPDNWLLLPAPKWLLDGLAQLEATLEGLEPDTDREPDTDTEESCDDEGSDSDAEPDWQG